MNFAQPLSESQLTELGPLPKDWRLVHLSDLGSFTKGSGIKKDQTVPEGLPCIRYGEIYTHHHDYIRTFNSFIPREIAGQARRIKRGDLLFAGSGETAEEIGKCVAFLDDGEAYAGGDIIIFSPSGQDSLFLGYLMNHSVVAVQKARAGQGDAVVHIRTHHLAEVQILLPPPSEQTAIATAISDVDSLIESLEKLIAKKRAIKQGAMQELLTGRRRLPGFQSAWQRRCIRDIAIVDPETIGAETTPDYHFRYISLENVDHGVLSRHTEQIFRSAPSRARKKLRHGDILVSTVRPNLKSHLLFEMVTPDWICSTGFSVLRCKENVADPRFVYFHLFAYDISSQIDALLTGSNYPSINSSDVRALEIPVPQIDEQIAVANVLADLDAEIAALRASHLKYRDIRTAMMQALLTGRIRLMKN